MGIATIQAQSTLQLRIDPEAIEFEYALNTFTQDTYGGKVIQILSVSVTDMSVPCVAGAGGREYLSTIVKFFKETMIWQRDSQNVAKFIYAPLNYNFDVFASTLTIQDQLANVLFPYTMGFKIRQDVGGYKAVQNQLIDAEMKKLVDGIGYTKNKYNDPSQNTPNTKKPTDPPAGSSATSGSTSSGGAAPASGTPATTPGSTTSTAATGSTPGTGGTVSNPTSNAGSGGTGAAR
jgi:hypothetical protein